MNNQFNVKHIVDDFTEHESHIYLSQPEQPHKNAVIERFWRTLALILQRARTAIKNFDWVKALPAIMKNYNSTYHIVLKASSLQVLEGKKENHVERKVFKTVLEKNDRVRVNRKKTIYDKGDVAMWSKDIYQIIEKKGKMFKLKNLSTEASVLRRRTRSNFRRTREED
jgi:predicted RNA-binding protein YlqC (UPF0109 family)